MKHRKEKDLLLPVTKLIEKIPDATNNKEYYQWNSETIEKSK